MIILAISMKTRKPCTFEAPVIVGDLCGHLLPSIKLFFSISVLVSMWLRNSVETENVIFRCGLSDLKIRKLLRKLLINIAI